MITVTVTNYRCKIVYAEVGHRTTMIDVAFESELTGPSMEALISMTFLQVR